MEREELIKRIIDEKGEKAVDDLIKLLDDEDTQIKEIVSEALFKLGEYSRGKLVKEFKRRLSNGKKNDITLLYIIDLLSDLGEKSIVKDLYSTLSLYSFEEAELIIYEALAKLGEGEKVYDILKYFLIEDAEKKKFGVQAAIALSYIDKPEVVDDLVKAIDSGDYSGEDLDVLKKALSNVVMGNSIYYGILKKLVGEDVEKYLGDEYDI
ncbi:hypothetical protein SU69_06895 [Thermosipho melanesiensis]|uniref:PBS lyase HEAT domain protein repeat-containing protein n=2 Tax=Thermosipho melanesiensis TaxID=46541 RepID=A6LMQ8_THEM4|nr:hypothetical protein [Thermosipho melanesiensis]ABR31209.1 hypothetical protein Tmel_1362 [Thermosipho melanesiensis BI429]APT74293.1 hypothetical protein BW47_07220 [Thermosipho melanesiensis]OOC36234.1 hypothetical protein SU68_06965 [Thermosipho melanesiensis]OOC37052.1 hypothetical protein SU69_06895 [Thermosipho melanesiensis]OOC37804.1 hypothetical protein SU70_06905 [Thermosipho melanesiensis]